MMSTPFDPQPLTPAQQQQVDDRKSANGAIEKVLAALGSAQQAFLVAEMDSAELTRKAQQFPAIEVDTNALISAETVYRKAQDLVRNLGSYLGGVQGWRGGIGQPNHETYQQLLDRLKGSWPDAATAVGL